MTSVLLAISQALTNFAVPTGSNWTEQVAGSVSTNDRRGALRLDERRVGGAGDPVRGREVQDQREQHAADHDRLPADAVAEPAEVDVERGADDGHHDEQQVLGRGRKAERPFEEHLHVEEGEIPDGALRTHDAEEGDEDALQILPVAERFAQRRLGDLAFLTQPRELGLSASLARIQTEMASSIAETRNGMRQPQALKASSPMAVRVATITSSAASRPNEADDWIQPVAAPRLLAGACSAT